MQAGIEAALDAGLKVKINAVALAQDNAAEIPALIQWAHDRGMDMTLIETMPMGEIDEDRSDQFLSLAAVRRDLESYWTLRDLPLNTGGPARYVEIAETGGRLGLITPMTPQFLRGLQPRAADLHRHPAHLPGSGRRHRPARGDPLRRRRRRRWSPPSPRGVDAKPKGHDFQIEPRPGPRCRATCRRRAAEMAVRVLLFGKPARRRRLARAGVRAAARDPVGAEER